MTTPKVIRDLPNKTLTVEKEFRAPLPKVWNAWTTSEALTRWWGPKGWPASSTAFDFREGGRWHYSMTGPNGERVWNVLVYRHIVPLAELRVEDYFSDPAGAMEPDRLLSRWEVTFCKVSSSVTKVTTRLVCITEAKLQYLIDMGFEAGFSSALENLTEHLEGRGEPLKILSADGTPLVYEKLGTGPAVILVGGAMVTRTLDAQTELAAALSSQFTVYNYDRRGRGDSGDTAPYSVDREIDDLAALVTLAGGSAAVYALSSGAILALRAAARGVPFTKLVLWEPPFIVGSDKRMPGDALAVVTDLIARGRKAAAATYFMTKIFGMPAFLPLLLRLTPFWKPTLAVAPSLPYDLAITGDGSIPASVAGVKVPALVLHGDHTQPRLARGAQALAQALPLATLKALPGVNHQVATTDLAPAVAAFLQGDPSREG